MNKKDIAKAFDVSLKCVDDWILRGMPFIEKGGKGRSYAFSLPACIEWHKNRFLKGGVSEGDGDIPSIGISRAKYEHFRAFGEQLATEEKAGSLVNVQEIQKELFTSLRGIRDAILNIAPRVSTIVAAELGHPDLAHRVNKIIEKEIHDILSDMSNIKLRGKGGDK